MAEPKPRMDALRRFLDRLSALLQPHNSKAPELDLQSKRTNNEKSSNSSHVPQPGHRP
ncbi:hypothetical protein MTMN5_00747 [Marinobacter salarius]|jgi:hypothetical protein|nr:hypothetical protein MTMN5_00747 [Marinobacter salarius]